MTATLEDVYEALAQALDRVGEERAAVFLAKVALALAEALDDPDRARDLVALAERDLGA